MNTFKDLDEELLLAVGDEDDLYLGEIKDVILSMLAKELQNVLRLIAEERM